MAKKMGGSSNKDAESDVGRKRQAVKSSVSGKDGKLDAALRARAATDEAIEIGLIEESPEPILRTSSTGAVLFANSAAGHLLRHWRIARGELLPAPWSDVLAGLMADKNPHAAVEMECDGRIYSLALHAIRARGYVNVWGRDVTESRQAEAEARRIVHHDPLTGLPNRTLFQDRLEQTVRQSRRARTMAAVHLINLDYFKEINDTIGHTVGDELLKAVAERLRGVVRDTDTIARLGADEFAVIQGDLKETEGADILAQKILDGFKKSLPVDGHNIDSSATLGISLFPHDGEDAQQILRNADLALFHAKSDMRGGYRFFVSKMNETVQRRRAIEQDLRIALERQEFTLYYQPKLNIRDCRVGGMEALIRWRHPEHGFLSPAEFIPVAERSRLIVPIGEWSLFEACRRTKAWHDAGLPKTKVAVNLSAVQFREKTLVETVKWVLDAIEFDPEYLELEITESVAMSDVEDTVLLFKRLADLGLSLSIDDFGTGYSSLSYLKRFPVKRIKIDKAFVSDIGTDQNPGAIARAVTTLGHSFGMEITAEGVETEQQLNFLLDIGCDEVQGYFFSRPLSSDDFRTFLDAFDQTQPAVAAIVQRNR